MLLSQNITKIVLKESLSNFGNQRFMNHGQSTMCELRWISLSYVDTGYIKQQSPCIIKALNRNFRYVKCNLKILFVIYCQYIRIFQDNTMTLRAYANMKASESTGFLFMVLFQFIIRITYSSCLNLD